MLCLVCDAGFATSLVGIGTARPARRLRRYLKISHANRTARITTIGTATPIAIFVESGNEFNVSADVDLGVGAALVVEEANDIEDVDSVDDVCDVEDCVDSKKSTATASVDWYATRTGLP